MLAYCADPCTRLILCNLSNMSGYMQFCCAGPISEEASQGNNSHTAQEFCDAALTGSNHRADKGCQRRGMHLRALAQRIPGLPFLPLMTREITCTGTGCLCFSSRYVSVAQPERVLSSLCDIKAGEYAYHADPDSSGQYCSARRAPAATHGRLPFKASCGSRLGGAFGKTQVQCCW